MITQAELRRDIYIAMLAKSGVREFLDAETNQLIWEAAILAANGLLEITPGDPDEDETMALPDYFKTGEGTAKTIKNSGGSAPQPPHK